jgi:aquaporin Z
MDQRDMLRRGVAEALGTGALIFIGSGSIVALTAVGSGSLLQVALANGLILAIMVTALGHISGAHFNPAVTFGFWVTRRITTPMAGVYVFFQLLGAVVGALLVRGMFADRFYQQADGGAPTVSGGVTTWEALLTEIVLTFLLVLVVFATAVDPRGAFKLVGGFAIGLTIAADILVGGPLTGAAMNPARAFGPELVSGTWSDAWLYWVAPLIGGSLAAGIFAILYLDRTPVEIIGRPGTDVEEGGIARAERDV